MFASYLSNVVLTLIVLCVIGVSILTAQPVSASTVSHCGSIVANETWAAADNVHLVTCDVVVETGVTLTIEEGAIVKLERDDTLFIEGKLVANGTASDPIYFTSYRDDSIGGDTNGDGVSTGGVEDWGRIRFNDMSDDTSSIQHAIIRYSGNDGLVNDTGAIQLDNASPTLQDISFSDNFINGIDIAADILATDTWDNSDIVYFIRSDKTIPKNSTLSIAPGVIVKFSSDDSIFVDGELQVNGTSSANVIFTSYRDDKAGGDTNNDGLSVAVVRDWGGLYFNENSSDTSIIEHASIRYSGDDGFSSNNLGAIALDNASPVLRDITFNHNAINGIEVLANTLATDTWDNSDVVYYIRSDKTIPAESTLSIAPGVIVKFERDDSLFVDGTLQVNGTSSANVIFTSYRDDKAGGDTNNDDFSAPAVEDWGRIQFNDSSADTSIIEHATIRYSGNDGPFSTTDFGAITLDHASPILRDITFTDNYYDGVEVFGGNWGTDTWDNTDVIYYLTGELTIVSPETLTIASGMQLALRADVTVQDGASLVINSGSIVKLDLDHSLLIDGKLQVLGTESAPVYMTSYRDDTIGGDTNGDGASAGMAKEWGRIRFNEMSDDTSTIEHAIIRYSGEDGSSRDIGAIQLDNASPTLQNITFSHNFINGAELTADSLETDSWDNSDVVYFIQSDKTIPPDSTLSIAEGVIVKFSSDDSLIVDGTLQVNGTSSANVIFTSYRDDKAGGDTNNDDFSAPAVKDWGRIEFNESSAETSIIEHATIRYSGNDGFSSSNFGAITLDNASPTIRNVLLTENYRGIEALGGSSPVLTCNDIYNNTSFGIYNDTPAIPVNAQNHWWGAGSGPTHSQNPAGTGQSVSDGVNYAAWASLSCFEEASPTSEYLLFLPLTTR